MTHFKLLCKVLFSNGVMRNKRPMVKEEDYRPINLDDEDDTPNPSSNPNMAMMQNLFSDYLILRPLGQNTSQKGQRSSRLLDATLTRYSSEDVQEQLIESARIQQSTVKTIAKETKKRAMLKTFMFLATPIQQTTLLFFIC